MARSIGNSSSSPLLTTAGGRAFFVCALLVAGFVLLNLPYLLAPIQIQSDEHFYVVAADRMMASGDYVIPETLSGDVRLRKPPLAYYYIVAGVSLFGQSIWATKLLWLASAAAVLALTFRLARLLGAGVTGAAVAVAALGGHRAFFRSATQHIPDMPLVLGTTIALVGFVALLAGQGGKRRWLLYLLAYAGVAIGVLAKGGLAPAVLLAWVGARLAGRRTAPFPRGEWRLELAAVVFAILATGWWFLLAAWSEPAAFQNQFFGDQVSEKVVLSVATVLANLRKLVTDILGPALPFLLTLFLGVGLSRLRPGARWREAPVLMLILWIGTVMLIFSPADVLYERYVLPALPAAAALLGLAAERVCSAGLAIRLRRAIRVCAVIVAVIAVATAIVLGLSDHAVRGGAVFLAAIAGGLLAWRSAAIAPTWARAGLLGAAYPMVFIALLPLHFTFNTPTRDAFAAQVLSESGIPSDRVWVIGSRKQAGRIGIFSGGVAAWHHPARLDRLPVSGAAAVIAEDPDIAPALRAQGFEVHMLRGFDIEKLTLPAAVAALRTGDFEAAGRADGPVALVGLRP